MSGIIFIIVIIVILFILNQYNKLVVKRNEVEQELSCIDIYLMQRFDLIPNLVECVKGYSKYENELFEKITKMRAEYANTKDLSKGEELCLEYNKLISYIENYPVLKASEQYLSLQQKLTKIENQLQAARRLYNGAVTSYNIKISVFPTNIIATIFGFKKAKLFEMEMLNADENVKIDL